MPQQHQATAHLLLRIGGHLVAEAHEAPAQAALPAAVQQLPRHTHQGLARAWEATGSCHQAASASWPPARASAGGGGSGGKRCRQLPRPFPPAPGGSLTAAVLPDSRGEGWKAWERGLRTPIAQTSPGLTLLSSIPCSAPAMVVVCPRPAPGRW